ncbi:MAG: pentapeptide repeat-containing protein, partial [Microcystis panniformis]
AADFRDNQIAQEQKHQEILTDYFSKMQGLIVETKKIKETSGYKESHPKDKEANLLPEFRSTAQALTLSVLEQLDGERKGKVITYLAESQLINKIDPLIQLGGANLQKLELKGRQVFSSINIVGANMTATELSDILISDSDLSTVNLTDAVLQDVTFENSDLSGINFD